ncbi:hypothetical protein J7L05_01050 [bacterium]|nr:hypothetical protein [bacterium]
MWKIVRNEITYLNTRFNVVWYFPTAYLVLLGILLFYNEHLGTTDHIHFVLIELCIATMIMAFFLKLIEFTHYELSEKRVKQQSLLPLPRWQIGFTRFLIPTILLGLLLILYTIFLSILLASGIFAITVKELLVFTSFLIILTYCLRLYTEISGRVFIVTSAIMYIMIGIYFTPVNLLYDAPIFRFQKYATTISGAIQISAFISIFLWVSFMMRKSYLK